MVYKEGSWCICLYYRDLKKNTIKDKFHIPFIHELIHELHQVVYITKLDLHSVYNQIRMSKEQIPQKTIRTDEDNYDFCDFFFFNNELLTSKILTNSILNTTIRKFVLVFFDDILT